MVKIRKTMQVIFAEIFVYYFRNYCYRSQDNHLHNNYDVVLGYIVSWLHRKHGKVFLSK